ncbi:MAG TPA: hypothetical protein DCO86_00680 [Spirochaetaceae bacterium]|nr:hypothetical protein [Spirochaetaceae bacterium]
MLTIAETRSIPEGASFVDLRHTNRDAKLVEALEKVKSYCPMCMFEVREGGRLVATTYANENTWTGQKTLFISSVKMRKGTPEAKVMEIFDFLLDFYEKKAKSEGYDAIIFEDSEIALRGFFEKRGYSTIRELVNFSGKRSKIARNLSSRADAKAFSDYKFVELDLEDIYKYSSFQDTRPGWNTSNLSIVKNKFNTMLSLADKSDTVYAVCVYDDRFGLVSRIAVHPLSRKKGFGSLIFKEAVHRMKNEDIFVSDIIKDAENANLFLMNLGFSVSELKFELHKEFNESYERIGSA